MWISIFCMIEICLKLLEYIVILIVEFIGRWYCDKLLVMCSVIKMCLEVLSVFVLSKVLWVWIWFFLIVGSILIIFFLNILFGSVWNINLVVNFGCRCCREFWWKVVV